MRTENPKTIYLKDYTPPAYQVLHIDLSFDLYEDKTIVESIAQYKRLQDSPLILNGENLELISIEKDGKPLTDYTLDSNFLTIEEPGDLFTLKIVTEIDPAANTALEGLYKSGGNYCTQCEAEGFRRISYYQDRPDVLTTFTVKIEADKSQYPVLLSNGDLIEESDQANGRHYTIWEDKTPKPCYLFALVAGDLVFIQDKFITRSNNKVDLRIYVRRGDENQCQHAMQSLIKSMKWDEEVYGREYQYNRFNIVAVSDFNMGAMENTSLNIFNTALVLAHPDTATDSDFMRVESVIAHEYFHNWTGNRVTCRDWFQLSLKEGLTVFRDQEFSADLNSRAVQRIDDVQHLRRLQFPEDASPLSHPIRPDNYIEINNFYTMTVYEKGAEVIRMFHTLLGPEVYRKATDLYFDRHDGQAVTCEDWIQCMADASELDLEQFKLWYSQAGTPEVSVKGNFNEENQSFTLTLEQIIPDTAGQTDKKPMHIPVAVGLLDNNGHDIIKTRILNLKDQKQSFIFDDIESKPIPSLLRGFSAPIKLSTDLSNDDLRFLIVHDSDGFNRWDATQTYALQILNLMIDADERGLETDPNINFVETFGCLLKQALEDSADYALIARMLSIPDISTIGQTRAEVNPNSIHRAREEMKRYIRTPNLELLHKIYYKLENTDPSDTDNQKMAKRALRNVVLNLIDEPDITKKHYNTADNMTDRVAALSILTHYKDEEKEASFSDFYTRFQQYQLVVDKWFAIQASAMRNKTIEQLKSLQKHDEFNITNPNRVRALYGAFAMNNPVCFHQADGAGYDFLKEAIIELNSINPQIAARLLTPLREWRRYTQDRQEKMKSTLEDIAASPNLSADVFEIVTKSLKE